MVLKKAVFALLFSVFCRYFYIFLVRNGIGVHYNNVYPGSCRVVPGIECGSEQISVTKDGLAFITNGFRELTNCNKDFLRGRIYLFDFNAPDENVVELEFDSPSLDLKNFDPHGMDILDDGETIKVYIVNHANGQESVEKFLFSRDQPKRLTHLETIKNEKFICLNDLVVMSEHEFYITNWIKTCGYPQIITVFEFFLEVKTGDIVHYKDGKTDIAATGPGINGITASADKKEIIAALSTSVYLHVYDRSMDGKLSFKKEVLVGHNPDNIYTDVVSGKNHYYVGVQKRALGLLSATKNGTQQVSSSAVKVSSEDNWNTVYVEEVFHDDGRNLVKGVSSGVHYKGQYLFGTVFEKLAYCKKE